MSEVRRQPQRQAHDTGTAARKQQSCLENVESNLFDSEEAPLEEALKQVTSEELDMWDGWVDFESDPVLFQSLLQHRLLS